MIRYTLTTEGTSDRVLLRHIDWLLEQHSAVEFNGQWANPQSFLASGRDVKTRIQESIKNFPCDLIFVHRDSDNVGRDDRVREIREAVDSLELAQPAVCVIPIKMTESWLLIDETAIRTASGNPRGRSHLHLPARRAIENIADPKAVLEDVLVTASEATGRKRKQLMASLGSAKYRVASLIHDLSILRSLDGFAVFEEDLRLVLSSNGWANNP